MCNIVKVRTQVNHHQYEGDYRGQDTQDGDALATIRQAVANAKVIWPAARHLWKICFAFRKYFPTKILRSVGVWTKLVSVDLKYFGER